jgi:ubiquitin-activating enzyme E1
VVTSECLPDDLSGLTEESCAPMGCRYDGQIAVFGRDFQKKLEAQVKPSVIISRVIGRSIYGSVIF